MTGFRHLNARRRFTQSSRVNAVADLLAEGASMNEVAARLRVTLRTAQKDFAAIRKQLGSQAV